MSSELSEHIVKERNSIRTIAGQLGDLYIKFKVECVKRGISVRFGIEEAIRDVLKKWKSNAS